jgi:YrbI family 3-deoxy-D-manno-octulosonate 8-phosphate phosphatase
MKKIEVLALIPARGGSKGIPHKNVRDFGGHPLIVYSIMAGLRSKLVTRTIVSTDDEHIAEISRQIGAEVPFMRPARISDDNTADLPVFEHALQWLKEREGYQPAIVVQLRPTSPIRPVHCVDEAIQILQAHPEADSVRGVVVAGQCPYKMWTIDGQGGQMKPLLAMDDIPEAYNAPRQTLPAVYWQTGHIDAIRAKTIIEKHSMSGDVIFPLILDPAFTVDIDNVYEWQQAEYMLWNRKLDMVDPAGQRRTIPPDVKLLVLDFDGVITDNRVWVDEQGHERVVASRADSMGLNLLRKETAIQVMVISTETNPVVTARCNKLGLPVLQSVDDKAKALRQVSEEKNIPLSQIIYMGNDVNDAPCFPLAACAIVPCDAEPEVLRMADIILRKPGGHGAVRELCELLLMGKKGVNGAARV